MGTGRRMGTGTGRGSGTGMGTGIGMSMGTSIGTQGWAQEQGQCWIGMSMGTGTGTRIRLVTGLGTGRGMDWWPVWVGVPSPFLGAPHFQFWGISTHFQLGGWAFPVLGGSQPISNWDGGSPIPILWRIPPTSSLPGGCVCGVSPPNREKAATPTPQHLNPLDLLHRLDALLPPESLLVADGGDFVGTAAYIVRPRRPLAWLDPGKNHTHPPSPSPRHAVTVAGTHTGDTAGCHLRRSFWHVGSRRRVRTRRQALPSRRGGTGLRWPMARAITVPPTMWPHGVCPLPGTRFGSSTVTARWATA